MECPSIWRLGLGSLDLRTFRLSAGMELVLTNGQLQQCQESIKDH